MPFKVDCVEGSYLQDYLNKLEAEGWLLQKPVFLLPGEPVKPDQGFYDPECMVIHWREKAEEE